MDGGYYCQDIGLVGDEKKSTNYDIKNVLPDIVVPTSISF
jgi:hypothetical protein